MRPTSQATAISPIRRPTDTQASSKSVAKPKKLSAAAVETTAAAFMAGFNALPSAVKWRIVQMIEAQEDEADARELAAARAANPEDFARENAVPFEQVMAEYEMLHDVKLT